MQSLTDFRSEYLALVLRFLWRQWSALGVAGHAGDGDGWAVDPEALLALTCTMARHDSRLFDEVLDWLLANERFVNVQRLKTVMRAEGFAGSGVLAAVAGFLADRGRKAKWGRLAVPDTAAVADRHLFCRPDGAGLPLVGPPDPLFLAYGWRRHPVELRGLSAEFPPYAASSLWLRLRGLFGVSARCEILLYLLLVGRGGSSTLARQTYYFHRTIQDALAEMNRSGLLSTTRLGRERVYTLPDGETWRRLLRVADGNLPWICWPALLSALEAIWLCMQPDTFAQLPPMLQMSELRRLMREKVADKLARSGVDVRLPDHERLPGMEYLAELLDALRNLLG
jgi:hypothetical protein